MSANPLPPIDLQNAPPIADQSANLKVYRNAEVVAYFVGLNYLTACERLLFDTYIKQGSAVLDLGVGGGRTTPYLSNLASHYVGVDYSDEMIRACRAKYPGLEFEVADACDLSRFADGSFDAVVFSFNGMDYLSPDDKRHRCLRECRRVLKEGGTLIFSCHNSRSLIVGWGWDWNRLRAMADKIAPTRLPSPLVLACLCCAKVGIELWRVSVQSVPRAFRRLLTRTFWSGDGYLNDRSHGGLWTHCAIPAVVIAELKTFSFKVLQVLPEDYPRAAHVWSTPWFYYACSK